MNFKLSCVCFCSRYVYVRFLDDLFNLLKAMEGACAPRVSGVELESLISSVKDLLPDLGEGFIEVNCKK